MSDIAWAETPGGRLAHTREGSGEPLLLIMGVAGHHEMWGRRFVDGLTDRYDVVAYDHRGIGESARADEPFTIADLAGDAAAVLDHLGWDTAHVMGISMGGTVAQELALSHPERVRRLVLGCTWAGPDADGAGVWGDAVGKLAEAAGSDPLTAARLMFEANHSAAYAAEPGHFETFVEAAAAAKVPGPVILMQMQAAAAFSANERLAELEKPTLVLHGTADEVILAAAGERLASSIPAATLERFDGVGHLFFWEEPERTASLVSAHLAG